MKKILGLAMVMTLAASTFLAGCASNNAAEKPSAEATVADEPVVTSSSETDIAFGDYAAMEKFSKKAQNMGFEAGQEVTIDGVISIGFSTASIGQSKDGNFVGTTLDVTGWTLEDFPEEDTRVKVKAKLVQDEENYFFYLKADPSDVKVVE